VLELRPNCENCNTLLPPETLRARICTFECTFCADCADGLLGNICPNCGGGFSPRPIRPVVNWRGGNHLGAYPASTASIHRPVDMAEHARLSALLAGLPPEAR
jgi:hypothetical protein